MIATAHVEHPATTGLLVETGTAMVWLMLHGHVPDAPPEPLRQLASPVRDRDGLLIDWHFQPPQPLDPQDVQRDVAAFETFRHWRSQWTTERAVADATTVKLFLAWADKHADVSALHALSLHHAHINADVVPRAGWQIARLRKQLDGAGDALALLDAERGTVIRGFPPVDEQPVIVLANSEAHLELEDAHLTLAMRRHTAGSWTRLRIPVEGWRIEDDGLTLTTAEDRTEVLNASAAALLTELSVGHTAIRVATVSLKRLLSPMLASLADIMQLADAAHARVYVRRGSA